jgi:hypothetical protein
MGEPEPRAREKYWGLRPRRAVRRWSMAVLAIALLGVIVAEAIWLVRHAA